MKADYPIKWLPASPDYVLACIQEEWRQTAVAEEDSERERQVPTFSMTVHEWREAMDLLPWRQLALALNKQWGTTFSAEQWYEALEPPRRRTLHEVCHLLSTAAKRPVVAPARLMGHDCPAAGLFLAIRCLLVRAGAPRELRPSTPLEWFLKGWPKVFVEDVARLVPGGLPFEDANYRVKTAVIVGSGLGGVLLLLVAWLAKDAGIRVVGLLLLGFSWLSGYLGGELVHGRPNLPGAKTFRDLTELIVRQQHLCQTRTNRLEGSLG